MVRVSKAALWKVAATMLFAGSMVTLRSGSHAAASTFAPRSQIGAAVDETHAVVTADFDGDGDADVAASDYRGGRVLWFRNDAQAFISLTVDTDLAGAYPLQVADLDQDGDPDLLAGGYLSDTIVWYANDGRAGFARRVLSTTADGVHSLVPGDLDRDGDMDILVANQDGHSVWWMENNGVQQFVVHEIDPAAWGAKRSELADVDGDGDIDVVSANSGTTEIALLVNDGLQRFTKRVIDNTVPGAYYVSVGDLDGDGDVDLAAASEADDTVAWYENDGRGTFTVRSVDTAADGARTVVCVDLDGDGDVDLVAASANDDTVAWYENNGRSVFTWRTLDVAADGAYGIAIADLDSDGDRDVLAALRDADEVSWYRQDALFNLAASVMVSVAPARILDTRAATAVGYRGDRPAYGSSLRVQVTGRGGVPETGVTAVAANVTVTEPTHAGFVQAYPTGSGRPGASSNLNVDQPGRTIAAASIIPLGSDGSITLLNRTGGHLIVDVTGYLRAAPSPVAAGRFVSVSPTRLLDSRFAIGHNGPQPGPDALVRVQISGRVGVPSGATAVVGNLTASGGSAPLYVQAGPAGGLARRAWSNLNLDAPAQTRANQIFVPLSDDGVIELFTTSDTHLIFDLTGWYTGDAHDVSLSGRFVPVSPTRLLDTRRESAVSYSAGKPDGIALVRISQATNAGLPADAAALSLTVTATEASDAGFVQVAPAGQLVRGASSTLNLAYAGQTIANGTSVGSNGGVDLHVPNGAHLVVDLAGFYIR